MELHSASSDMEILHTEQRQCCWCQLQQNQERNPVLLRLENLRDPMRFEFFRYIATIKIHPYWVSQAQNSNLHSLRLSLHHYIRNPRLRLERLLSLSLLTLPHIPTNRRPELLPPLKTSPSETTSCQPTTPPPCPAPTPPTPSPTPSRPPAPSSRHTPLPLPHLIQYRTKRPKDTPALLAALSQPHLCHVGAWGRKGSLTPRSERKGLRGVERGGW